MFKQNSILILGLWLIVLGLFIKIPKDWIIGLYILTGVYLIVVYISSISRQSIQKMLSHHSKSDTYTDSPIFKAEPSKERINEPTKESVN